MRTTVAILCGPERHQWINPQLSFWLAGGMGHPKNTELGVMPVFGLVPVDHARNFAADHFLNQTKSDWLLMIDNDIAPVPNLFEILDDLGDHVRIVAPMTYMWNGKTHAPNLVNLHVDEDYFVPTDKPHRGKNKVAAVGTGCIFIHREVFEKLDKPYFEFVADYETGAYTMGEDYHFCRKAHEVGFNTYADSRFICGHFHTLDLVEVNIGWAAMLDQINAQKEKGVELATEGQMDKEIKRAKVIKGLKQ